MERSGRTKDTHGFIPVLKVEFEEFRGCLVRYSSGWEKIMIHERSARGKLNSITRQSAGNWPFHKFYSQSFCFIRLYGVTLVGFRVKSSFQADSRQRGRSVQWSTVLVTLLNLRFPAGKCYFYVFLAPWPFVLG